jgi:hypothetical protein
MEITPTIFWTPLLLNALPITPAQPAQVLHLGRLEES